MKQVDRVISDRLTSESAPCEGGGRIHHFCRGKRLRPALLLLFSGALDNLGPHSHVLAAVVEFIHTHTAAADDVVDESTLRRKSPDRQREASAMRPALLVGDFSLLTRFSNDGQRMSNHAGHASARRHDQRDRRGRSAAIDEHAGQHFG
ncbi:MAG: polyprenyl synthetase family protein [Burkholderiaceae bacterium]